MLIIQKLLFCLGNNAAEDTVMYQLYGKGYLGAGDTLYLYTDLPFNSGIGFHYVIKGQKVNTGTAKNTFDKIRIVPNPYVVTA